MQIIAKSNLSLLRKKNEVKIYYDTYEPSTFDQYLMASLAKNSKSKKEAYDYIDDITGKGSLNHHFKNLYDKTMELKKDQIDKILSDSLYPVTRIANEFYCYYPQLDISLYHGKSHEGDLENRKEVFISAILPKEANGKYRDINIAPGIDKVVSETRDLIYDEEGIYIDFGDGNPHFLEDELAKKINPNQLEESLFLSKGIALSSIDEKARDYKLLDNAVFNELMKEEEKRFLNEKKESVKIDQDCFAKLEVIKVFNTYFYREIRLEFSKKNKSLCDGAIKRLMDGGQINNFKTKTLISILENSTDLVAQEAVNYVLTRKNSKEIAEVGLHIMNQGVYKGWEKETLISIRRALGSTATTSIYQCDPTLGYSIDDLVSITNKSILLDEDKQRLEKYLEDRGNKINQIYSWRGEMSSSGVRENMKSLKNKDGVHEQLKKFLNKTAHVQKDINERNDKELDALYKEVKSIYEGPYQKIKERVEKNKS